LPDLPMEEGEVYAEALEWLTLAADAHDGGPLDGRTRRLVELAFAVSGRLEGSVRARAREAKEQGVTEAELDQVVLLGFTTLGLPSTVAARTWIRNELAQQ